MSSSTENTHEIVSESHEHTSDTFAPHWTQNPALTSAELAELAEKFHGWDNENPVIDPALWQRQVRLRRFRLFQRQRYGAVRRYEGDIARGYAYTADCLLDAELFNRRFAVHGMAVLGEVDRQAYKDMYGLTPEQVMSAQQYGILINTVNKIGTLAVNENTAYHCLTYMKALVNKLYQKLTNPVLEGVSEGLYSQDFLEEVLKIKKEFDQEFKYRERTDAERHTSRVDKQNEFVDIPTLLRSHSEFRRNGGASSRVSSQRESSSGARQPIFRASFPS